ncbi:MAG: leucyl aminopeptidase [Sedimentisphaerales bacterium]|nr:leucyl aminopeptidase [Sedimentisphaerales bacterium]
MARQSQTSLTNQTSALETVRADLLVLGLFAKTRRLPEAWKKLDQAANGAIDHLLKLGDFPAKAQETAILYPQGKQAAKRLLLVGLGDKKSFDYNVLRKAAGTAARMAVKLSAARMALALHNLAPDTLKPELIGQALAEGAIVGNFDYRDHLPKQEDGSSEINHLRVILIDHRPAFCRRMNTGSKVGAILGEAQNLSRSIDNMPGNEINPPSLARQAQKVARQYGIRCKVFDDRQLAKMKMNALLAVGSGSASKPRLIMLEYNGRRPASGGRPDAVVVGKAITFDSGGISIKPSANMEAMKFDKSGGCNVIGILAGLARLKRPLHVVGLIPAAENLPSHTSYRPGDIVRTYSGKTVEIQNTDAEGRLILCDALHYAARMRPKAIVDMATLTGACVVALGPHHAGLFSNRDELGRQIQKAAEGSGEPVWLLPCGAEYLEQMKSKIADLKNVSGREGGACTAAAFLGAFVEDVPWAHIDIAAVSDTDKPQPYRAIGATGFAVRLVLEYLRTV